MELTEWKAGRGRRHRKAMSQSKLEQLEALERAARPHGAADELVDYLHALRTAAPALLRLARAVEVAKPSIKHTHTWLRRVATDPADLVWEVAPKDVLDALAALTEERGD